MIYFEMTAKELPLNGRFRVGMTDKDGNWSFSSSLLVKRKTARYIEYYFENTPDVGGRLSPSCRVFFSYEEHSK